MCLSLGLITVHRHTDDEHDASSCHSHATDQHEEDCAYCFLYFQQGLTCVSAFSYPYQPVELLLTRTRAISPVDRAVFPAHAANRLRGPPLF
ncbi:MAG TPA: DUF2946 family protein [Candidatus Sphingobacterium stercorigallinarum]|nr:DUF2946 family protein [Candidatus Sphingobacterium stercorigallinarum]